MILKMMKTLTALGLIVTICFVGNTNANEPTKQSSALRNFVQQDMFAGRQRAISGSGGRDNYNFAWNNWGHVGDGLLSALNNKRARKTSAFIPMRGRKDGRTFSPLGQAVMRRYFQQTGSNLKNRHLMDDANAANRHIWSINMAAPRNL